MKDTKKLAELERLAEKDDLNALRKVIDHYYTLAQAGEDKEKLFHYLKKAEHFKDPELLFYLGNCYAFELGTGLNLTKAMEYYQLAAKQNHPKAYFNMAITYRDGYDGNLPDFNKAKECLLKAKKLSHPKADAALASLPYYEICYQLRTFDSLSEEQKDAVLKETRKLAKSFPEDTSLMDFIKKHYVDYVLQNYSTGSISDAQKDIVFDLSSTIVVALIEEDDIPAAKKFVTDTLQLMDSYQGDKNHILENKARLWWRYSSLQYMAGEKNPALMSDLKALNLTEQLYGLKKEDFPFDLMVHVVTTQIDLLTNTGNEKEAAKAGVQFMKFMDHSLQQFKKTNKVDYGFLLLALAKSYIKLRKNSDAEKCIQEVIELIDKPTENIEYDLLAQAHCLRGNFLTNRKKYEEAVEEFDKAIIITSKMADSNRKEFRLATYAYNSANTSHISGKDLKAKETLKENFHHCYYQNSQMNAVMFGNYCMLLSLVDSALNDVKDFLEIAKLYIRTKDDGKLEDDPQSDLHAAFFCSIFYQTSVVSKDYESARGMIKIALSYLDNKHSKDLDKEYKAAKAKYTALLKAVEKL